MARTVDADLLVAALAGYEQIRRQIEARIADLRRRVGSAMPLTFQAAVARPPRKHVISAEGRARIAAAQKRRWKAAKHAKAKQSAPKQAASPKQGASAKRTKGVKRATVSAAKTTTPHGNAQNTAAKKQIRKRGIPAKAAVKRTASPKTATKSVSRPRSALNRPVPNRTAAAEAISPL
jgi:hypothetical protein